MKLTHKAPAALALLAMATLSFALAACTGVRGDASVSGTTWGDPAERETPSITFDADGTVYGTDGCNRMTGGWKEKDGEVTFDELASTMMFCEGVDTWLSQSVSGKIEGNKLVFSNIDGEQIGTLEKTDG